MSKRFILIGSLALGVSMSSKALTPQEFFSRLNKNTMPLVNEFYAMDAHFQDPTVDLMGADRIRAHYAHQYEGLEFIKWDFGHESIDGERHVLPWKMTLKHPGLNGGEEYAVDGISVIDMRAGKAFYHRDYFDMGAFVYERIPVMRTLVKFLKGRMTDPKNASEK
ncbi:MAG: nuclear transport factor 2 family protein [Bdellovibrionota bacterium]